MSLFKFLEVIEDTTQIKVIENDLIVWEGMFGDIPQRVMNDSGVHNCRVKNNVLIIYSIVKLQEELEVVEEGDWFE